MHTLPTFRFAPSPHGYLHLGHAYSALLNKKMAKHAGGKFLLRIENIDQGRSRIEYEKAIYQDLTWLGLEWETPVRRQTEHMQVYQDMLQKLKDLNLLYPCFATRTEIKAAIAEQDHNAIPTDPDGAPLYPGLYKNLSHTAFLKRQGNGERFALRLDMEKALAFITQKGLGPLFIQSIDGTGQSSERPAKPEIWGDAILARKDIGTSYHLCVVVDDALQEITHVVRGTDLFHATDLHRLLQAVLELPYPVYHHHNLIFDDRGEKLSKSQGSTSLQDLRHSGETASDIYKLLGFT